MNGLLELVDVSLNGSRGQGRAQVLQGITLHAAAGEILGITGAAGSGKTALMRVLAGFARASFGQITMDAAPIAHLRPERRGFGIVQQPDRLFGHLTLGENVALPLRLRGLPCADRQTLTGAALENFRLAAIAGKRPGAATKAEQQRAVLARATVFGPRALLLDEPFAAEEGADRLALLEMLHRVHTLLGTTTLIAARDAASLLPVCDRLAVLHGGRLAAIGTPRDLYERPHSAAIAALFGETNLLPGAVAEVDDGIARVRLDCGPVAEAEAGAGLAPGWRCHLHVRPERIALAPGTAQDLGEGALGGSVIGAQFCGDTTRFRVLIGSGAEVIVRRQALAGLRGLRPGATVALAWQPLHARALGVSADD